MKDSLWVIATLDCSCCCKVRLLDLGAITFFRRARQVWTLISLNKWNHHFKTAFFIYSDYLCVILNKFDDFNLLSVTNMQKKNTGRGKTYSWHLYVCMLYYIVSRRDCLVNMFNNKNPNPSPYFLWQVQIHPDTRLSHPERHLCRLPTTINHILRDKMRQNVVLLASHFSQFTSHWQKYTADWLLIIIAFSISLLHWFKPDSYLCD